MKRVVVTGLGVVAPNGSNVPAFLEALKSGKSGLQFLPELAERRFSCQVAGVPDHDETSLVQYMPRSIYKGLRGHSIRYAALASIEALLDAGLEVERTSTDWDMGCIYGHAVSDLQVVKELIHAVEQNSPRRIGSRYTAMTMSSSPAAFLTNLFAFGNYVSSNANACATGAESILLGTRLIQSGLAKRMLVGSCESPNIYTWGSFEGMRITNGKFNDAPTQASRPMSESAAGIVLGSGAATLILEDLESALERGAPIYAEVLGGAANSGGQRGGGTMTMPNSEGVQRCMVKSLENANIAAEEVDLICGHLTATGADKVEVRNWKEALQFTSENFPYINSLKSMTGHCVVVQL